MTEGMEPNFRSKLVYEMTTMDDDSDGKNQMEGGPCPNIRIRPLRDIVRKPELFCVDYTGSVITPGKENETEENGALNGKAQLEALNAPSACKYSPELGMNLPQVLADFVPFPYEGPILTHEMLDEWVKNRDTEAETIDQVARAYFALPDEDLDNYDAGSEGSEDSGLSSSSSSKSILVPQRPVARKSASLGAAKKQWNRMVEQARARANNEDDDMNLVGMFRSKVSPDGVSSPEPPLLLKTNSAGWDSPARSDDSQATIPICRRPAQVPSSPVARKPAKMTARPFPQSPTKSSSPDAKPKAKKSAKKASRTPGKISAKPQARPAAKITARPPAKMTATPVARMSFSLAESSKPSLVMRNPSWTPEMERAAQEMYYQLTRSGPVNRAELERLLELTFPYRRSAYEDPELADVPTIFRDFPALRDHCFLKNELTLLKQLKWSTFERKLAEKCAQAEVKHDKDPLIDSALAQRNDEHSDNEELQRDIQLLCLAYQKTKGKLYGVVYKQMNEDEEPFVLNDLTPTIDIRGNLGDEDKTIRVYCEEVLVANAPNFYEAMLCVYAMYWLYGIVYPKAAEPFFKLLDKLSGLH